MGRVAQNWKLCENEFPHFLLLELLMHLDNLYHTIFAPKILHTDSEARCWPWGIKFIVDGNNRTNLITSM